MLNPLKRRSERRRLAARLCLGLSARAREPVFFCDLAVPDTFDGRFEVVAFHAWMVLEWLNAQAERELAQAFVDALFAQFEEGLRELGAGDIGMGRRMKKIASAFYGRLEGYRAAGDATDLAAALARNMFRGRGGLEHARLLANYASAAGAQLARLPATQGGLDFGPPPGRAETNSA